jgi:nucleotide-binding universal stress UspA family protein
MNRILLPTDFSVNSKNAIEYALQFFNGQSCSFYFLNIQKTSEYIMDDIMSGTPGSSVYQVILKDNEEQLKKFVSTFQEKYANEEYEFLPSVDYDILSDSIKQKIESEKIDLIVMGTNGVTGASEVLFGSNTLHVIRHVDCPVLAIPEGSAFKKLQSVLFTVSSCKEIKPEGIKPLKHVLDMYDPKLHILEIKTKKDAETHDCATLLNDVFSDTKFESHMLKGIPTPFAIDAFVQLINVDMHALFIEKESLLDRFIFGSETAKISYRSNVPLLFLRK